MHLLSEIDDTPPCSARMGEVWRPWYSDFISRPQNINAKQLVVKDL